MKVLDENELQRISKKCHRSYLFIDGKTISTFFNVTQIKHLTFLPFCHTSLSQVRRCFCLQHKLIESTWKKTDHHWFLLSSLRERTTESLLIHKGRLLLDGLCIMWSIFRENDGHDRWQTSRPVVGVEIKTNCHFEAHKYYFSFRLGFIWCCCFMLHFRLPYNLMVWI